MARPLPVASDRPHPHLYEINTWAWLEELSKRERRLIRLVDVPDREWDRLQELGFDFVWLMGLWRRSPGSRRIAQTDPSLCSAYDAALPGWQPRDVKGSPYAVQAYEPDPELGAWDEVDLIREKLHERRMRLILDFVPNHTARDHAWVTTHPEYYVNGTFEAVSRDPSCFFQVHAGQASRYLAHGKDPYFPPWTDTAQLNHAEPGLREALVGELCRIAQHCDGVRCDMAMLVLKRVFVKSWGDLVDLSRCPEQEFWPEAIAAVPGLVMMAEAYWDLEQELQNLGFSFTYDKRLYDRLRTNTPSEVRAHLGADLAYQSKLVRFLENHDEGRAAQVFGQDRLLAVGTLMATLPGMRMYHHGQLEGRRIHAPIQLRRTTEEVPQEPYVSFYENILHLTDAEVFHAGHWRMLAVRRDGDETHENLLAYQWRSSRDWMIVVVNLSAAPSRGRVELADAPERESRGSDRYRLVKRLGGHDCLYVLEDMVKAGVPIGLAPYGAGVWMVDEPSTASEEPLRSTAGVF